jgi:hypothetical protein
MSAEKSADFRPVSADSGQTQGRPGVGPFDVAKIFFTAQLPRQSSMFKR